MLSKTNEEQFGLSVEHVASPKAKSMVEIVSCPMTELPLMSKLGVAIPWGTHPCLAADNMGEKNARFLMLFQSA